MLTNQELYLNRTGVESGAGNARVRPEMRLTGFELNPIIPTKMSSASKIITPASSMSGVDWARFKTPELDSDIEDDDEIAMAKAKERCRRRVEKKRREDEEARLREEEEKYTKKIYVCCTFFS
ncbi:hypothetical protein BU15DRAFT_66960 [Melanogaster broomeanus]|nr:hypothetical protein BU15DRAFT_66960 [Melanogaster broomeanus]